MNKKSKATFAAKKNKEKQSINCNHILVNRRRLTQNIHQYYTEQAGSNVDLDNHVSSFLRESKKIPFFGRAASTKYKSYIIKHGEKTS